MREIYLKDGYVLLPNILSPDEVNDLREEILAIYAKGIVYKGDTTVVRFDILNRYPSLRWLMQRESVLAVLREILGGDFVFIAENATHRSHYSTWHRDIFNMSDDFELSEVAFYLQDNDQHGGGLDVIPGSHRDASAQTPLTIPSKAGDMLLFNFSLMHRATPLAGNPTQEKLALFFVASRNNHYVQWYWDRISRRDDYVYLHEPGFRPDLWMQ